MGMALDLLHPRRHTYFAEIIQGGILKAPLILLESGFNTWRILEPGYDFGAYMGLGSHPSRNQEDRRYSEKCIVKGSVFEALTVLHELEASRGQ